MNKQDKKERKTVRVTITGKDGKNSIEFNRIMTFRDASYVLVEAIAKPYKREYKKKNSEK